MRDHRRYTNEFKLRAMELARELSVRKAASQLGIPKETLHLWVWKQKNGKGIDGQPPVVPPEEEVRTLREENEQLRKANYILKQAAAFFCQDHLK